MPSLNLITLLALSFTIIFAAQNSKAAPLVGKSSSQDTPTIMRANEVDGDKNTNIFTAKGNVEVTKGNSIIYADKVVYEKNGGIIHAIGNVKIKNIEVGNLRALKADVKDDFTSGEFTDGKIIFNDGSYLTSPEIIKESPVVTTLKNPIFSICPNPAISANNDLAGKKTDFISIKSRHTTIDSEDEMMRSRGGILKFYKVPFFYTPYIAIPLPSKKKKSGFLTPSYSKNSNLGIGIKMPYYLYIAPNIDLTFTPLIGVDSNQKMLTNKFRHLTSYGEYLVDFEIANNEIDSTDDSTVTARTDSDYRWHLKSKGTFDFTLNTGVDFTIDTLGDRNYMRDYYFGYENHTISKVNLDYIKGRDYHAVKAIRIQEIENYDDDESAPFVVPIDSHIETKPLAHKQKFALTSNFTTIVRNDGLQYRRATATPEFSVPFNLHGNLFTINTQVQTDLYSLENNYKSVSETNDYDSSEANYKPEASFNWRLPLIKKSKKSTFMVEPMANMVISSYQKSFSDLPNEDSNTSELTVSNLFVTDRIAGFDRNESGKRFNYGAKSSLFNDYGEFNLTLGQGYRSGGDQDVIISGFNTNSKSNIVGQAMYKAVKYFSLTYSFQLDESNYRNDINQITSTLTFDRVSFSNSYLLLRKTLQNVNEKRQTSFSSKIKLTDRWSANLKLNRDLVINRNLSRSIGVSKDGCCTIFGFSVVETNPSSLNKSQKSFNLSLTFKNL